MIRIATVPVAVALLALVGCGGQDQNGASDGTTSVQDSSAAESSVGKSVDAATNALVEHATVNDVSTGFAASGADASGGRSSLDLGLTTSVDIDVQLENVLDAGGNRKYPNLSGLLHLHADGDVVNSWPTGSATLAHHTVTVVFDNVSYHDPECGATASIVSGTYSYTLDSEYHYTASENWTANFDAKQSVGSTTPLVFTVSRVGKPTRTVSVFGVRDAHLALARTNDTGSGGTTNRYVIDGQIDGTNGDGSTIDGVTGIDPANPADSYTNWDFTASGDHLVWNRRAMLNVQWDFTPTSSNLTLSGSDRVYLTLNGAKQGPYTAAQLKSRFHCTLDD
jgi:hypothetical protein